MIIVVTIISCSFPKSVDLYRPTLIIADCYVLNNQTSNLDYVMVV